MNLNVVILAAGMGKRMGSLNPNRSKVAYEILKKPMLLYVLKTVKELKPTNIVAVLGHGIVQNSKLLEGSDVKIVNQEVQRGTGDAIKKTQEVLGGLPSMTLVLCGDTPLITSATLKQMIDFHETNHADLTVLGATIDKPKGYGRLIMNGTNLELIREEKDCSDYEKQINLINSGIYLFDNQKLFSHISELSDNNNQREFYLTDMVGIFNKHKYNVKAVISNNADELRGVNNLSDLVIASKLMQKQINDSFLESGVYIIDPSNTYIGPDVTIGADTTIYPNTMIFGNSIIGTNNTIGPSSYLENVDIGDDNSVAMSHVTDSSFGSGNDIGPFARIRAHSEVGSNCRVGNFMEFKNVQFEDGSKAAHLSYIGDTHVGKSCNIGCGTITANYDGKNKFHTEIGEHVFIGSGSTLIAPLTISDNAFIAAGSTINHDVEEATLAIARERQTNKKDYAKNLPFYKK